MTINIDTTKDNPVALYGVVDSIRILPLSSETHPIGNVKDMCFIGDTAFVLDDITSSLIMVDTRNGQLIKSINRCGNRPEEYINPFP